MQEKLLIQDHLQEIKHLFQLILLHSLLSASTLSSQRDGDQAFFYFVIRLIHFSGTLFILEVIQIMGVM